ncbi:hypothetical protein CSUI_003673, partial [Cystoisospora suis]
MLARGDTHMHFTASQIYSVTHIHIRTYIYIYVYVYTVYRHICVSLCIYSSIYLRSLDIQYR